MLCPTDKIPLVMADRSGIEIDYCPECRGVWLDRGELDKIIERSAATDRDDDRKYRDDDRTYGGGLPKKKKRESLLSELFDFG